MLQKTVAWNYLISAARTGVLCALLGGRVMAQSAPHSRIITLPELFDSVRANHPLIAAANARARAARGPLISARSWANPVLSYESDQMSEQVHGLSSMGRETMTTAMLPLQPLYQRAPQIRRTDALLRAAEADALSQRQRVAMDAATAYYAVALAEVKVTTAQNLLGWLSVVVEYNEKRVRAGVTAEADLIRSGLERDRAQNELAVAESEFARARARLRTFITSAGSRDVPGVEIDSAPLGFPPIPHGILPSMLPGSFTTRTERPLPGAARPLAVRPEVVAARERVTATGAAVASEGRMLFREASMMLGLKQSGGINSLMTGFSLPFPLFDRNRGGLTTARAENEATKFELVSIQREADADLGGAQDAARVLTKRMVDLGSTKYLSRAEESRRIALGAYQEGGATLLQVLDAARAWREARMSYFETLYAQHQAILELLIAQGIDVLASPPTIRLEDGR